MGESVLWFLLLGVGVGLVGEKVGWMILWDYVKLLWICGVRGGILVVVGENWFGVRLWNGILLD